MEFPWCPKTEPLIACLASAALPTNPRLGFAGITP
jgi:hypothetical protein